MDFKQIAMRAYERGDIARALAVLVQGIKRRGGDEAALELLLGVYGNGATSPGFEVDVAAAIASHPEAGFISGQLVARLEERGVTRVVHALERALGELGVHIEYATHHAPPPEASAAPAPIEPADAGADVSAELELDDEQIVEVEDTDASELSPRDAPEVGDAREHEAADEQAPPAARPPEEAPRERAPVADAAAEVVDANAPTERIVRAPKSAPEEAPEVRSGEVPRTRPRLISKRAVAAVAAVAVVAAVGWFLLERSAADRALDQHLEMFDPLNPQAFETALNRAGTRWGSSQGELAAREDFVAALAALEVRGDYALTSDVESPWASGAEAMVALSKGDEERALTLVGVMERRWPRSLATAWSRARLEEERGRLSEAWRRYELASQRFDRFVPGALGQIRVAYRAGDREGLESAGKALQRLNPLHPYLYVLEGGGLGWEELLTVTVPGDAQLGGAAPDDADAFLEGVARWRAASRAWRRGDAQAAREALDAALGHDAMLGPALLVRGVLAASQRDVSGAEHLWQRLAQMEGVSASLRMELMIVAPRALTEAGSPDRALAWALDPGTPASLRASLGERADEILAGRPVSLALSKRQREGLEEQEAAALVSLAGAMRDSGREDEALAVLEFARERGLERPSVRLARALVHAQRGKRGALERALREMTADDEVGVVRTLVALLDGRDEDAIKISAASRAALSTQRDWLRARALALFRSGRSTQLLALLDDGHVSPMYEASVARLRMRALARQGRGNTPYVTARQAVADPAPTGLEALVDLAVASFWQGELEQAEALAASALALTPGHPEANWVMGLALRHEGETSKARVHLERARIGDENDPRLLYELGRVYAELGQWERAQKMFYRSLLGDRKSVRAIRALGDAYVRHDPELGRREFSRILGSYNTQGSTRAQAGEVLKWLAVLHGSRAGDEQALAHLTRAEELLGERADVLVERAKFLRARAEREPARDVLKRALRSDTTLAEAHLELARLELEGEDEAAAATALRRFLELEPHGERSTWAREKLRRMSSN
jgi:tetratricopeptide (TPR) repeat protein